MIEEKRYLKEFEENDRNLKGSILDLKDVSLISDHLIKYPTPINLNYFWGFGSLAGLILVMQMITGFFLTCQYVPHVDLAFSSIESLMRNVNNGLILRYAHANGATLFFAITGIHIARGLWYGSYQSPREMVWVVGSVIIVLMILTAFLGYSLVFGQQSLWGLSVITSLASVVPLVGNEIVSWLWGSFSVSQPLLSRAFLRNDRLGFVKERKSLFFFFKTRRFGYSEKLLAPRIYLYVEFQRVFGVRWDEEKKVSFQDAYVCKYWEISKPSVIDELLISWTKVNYCMKIGLPWAAYPEYSSGDLFQQNVWIRILTTKGTSNTKKNSNLLYRQSTRTTLYDALSWLQKTKIKFDTSETMYNYFIHLWESDMGVLINKHIIILNNSYYKEKTLSIDKYKRIKNIWKMKYFCFCKCYIKVYFCGVFIARDPYNLKDSSWELYGFDGGRIVDQAKAKGNALDIWKINFKRILHKKETRSITNFSSNKNYTLKYGVRTILSGIGPNSTLHRLDKLNCTSYQGQKNFSSSSRESEMNQNESRDAGNSLQWPDSKELKIIEDEVFSLQQKLAYLAEKIENNEKEIFKIQEICLRSKNFRIMAINLLAQDYTSKLPGLDGIILKANDTKMKLKLLDLSKSEISYPNKYKPVPLKIIVEKDSSNVNSVGISSIKDKVLQKLFQLVLDPVIEANSDINSYGYRKLRSAKNALGLLKMNFKTLEKKQSKYNLTPEQKWIMHGNITPLFSDLHSEWLLKNIPLHWRYKIFLAQWLKNKTFNNEFLIDEYGIPQTEILGPLLANFTLNGLEKVVDESRLPITKSKRGLFNITHKDKTKKILFLHMMFVRYVNEFVILARSQHIFETYVTPKINEFLKERGLSLNKNKTQVFTLSDEKSQLNFLGYSIKYYKQIYYKSPLVADRAGRSAIALYPNKENVKKLNQRLKTIIRKSNNWEPTTLIWILNPIIRKFTAYYNMSNSYYHLDKVEQYLFKLTWRWAQRKHRRWGKKKIALFYFMQKKQNNSEKNPDDKKKKVKDTDFVKIKNRKWAFHGKTKQKSRFKEKENENPTIYLRQPTQQFNILAGNQYAIPEKIRHLHAYSKESKQLIDFNFKLKLKAMKFGDSFKDKLFEKQKGNCWWCKKEMTDEQLNYFKWHIHHIVPISEGGSREKKSNLALVHEWCHKDIHRKKEETAKKVS